jgi:hypothetical protein
MAIKPAKECLPAGTTPAYPARLCSATEGRQTFPDILQDTYGEKTLTGLHGYGRVLGAIIPIEAVKMLMGDDTAVDEAVRLRIKNAALNLLEGQKNFR